ncbi:MAG: stress response translation initiation inhibitor YciH [Thermoplasmata archaeon HGW-Thermoplasmata-1]|nr:MAG: stress response translation initiation inhibitor YciH [Thermoplasmata archaeon HGW-Thermoplasmata-1]
MSEICDVCGLPKELCVCEEIAKEQQQIRIYADKRKYGKKMTVVSGIAENEIDMDTLVSKLKAVCACGGTLKDGKIELQGDHRAKVKKLLEEMGFPAAVI